MLTTCKYLNADIVVCGGGPAGCAAALTLRGLVSGERVTVSMPGGELGVSLTRPEDGVRDIFLTGPTCLVYEAELTQELLEGVCRTF